MLSRARPARLCGMCRYVCGWGWECVFWGGGEGGGGVGGGGGWREGVRVCVCGGGG